LVAHRQRQVQCAHLRAQVADVLQPASLQIAGTITKRTVGSLRQKARSGLVTNEVIQAHNLIALGGCFSIAVFLRLSVTVREKKVCVSQ
jgi:hypothetical protein